jgi:hypothetical protein
MSDLESKVNRTVQGFVAEVIELVRHTAVETLQVAFSRRSRRSRAVVFRPAEVSAISCRGVSPRRAVCVCAAPSRFAAVEPLSRGDRCAAVVSHRDRETSPLRTAVTSPQSSVSALDH